MNAYSTIVADPPWDYRSDPPRFTWAERHVGDRVEVAQPYPMLTVEQIAALPVPELAERDAHLYLWTTQRYLPAALAIVDEWDFTYTKTLAWTKAPRGFGLGGAWASATEFVIYARRGRLPNIGSVNRDHFAFPRPGNRHSAKPDGFLDLVEQVSPGPYLELFARRQRLGWHTWGNEALQHLDIQVSA